MIKVEVKYIIKSGQRDNFYNAVIQQGIDKASKSEEGNIKYAFEIPENENDIIYLHEIWKDDNAVLSHSNSEHYKALSLLKSEFVVDTIIEKKIIEG
ncbi:MAG: antibiotic biosynthesis monooxygenase [Clostridiales bacterium]|nr:antibiotic biosynthesis monooxygenase [Clostridiales bacterium]